MKTVEKSFSIRKVIEALHVMLTGNLSEEISSLLLLLTKTKLQVENKNVLPLNKTDIFRLIHCSD